MVMLALLAYLHAKWQQHAQETALPPAWALDYRSMTFGQLEQELGPPTESATAKGWIQWVVRADKQAKLLKVICSGTCAPAERPLAVHFLVIDESGSTTHSRPLFAP